MHADGAGTKSSLAYMYWKETGTILQKAFGKIPLSILFIALWTSVLSAETPL